MAAIQTNYRLRTGSMFNYRLGSGSEFNYRLCIGSGIKNNHRLRIGSVFNYRLGSGRGFNYRLCTFWGWSCASVQFTRHSLILQNAAFTWTNHLATKCWWGFWWWINNQCWLNTKCTAWAGRRSAKTFRLVSVNAILQGLQKANSARIVPNGGWEPFCAE